jgi:hypothetical protein
MGENLNIICLNCGRIMEKCIPLDEYADDYTIYKCQCGTDIAIDDDDIFKVDFADWLREKDLKLFKELTKEFAWGSD